jgi:L-fuconolactonase
MLSGGSRSVSEKEPFLETMELADSHVHFFRNGYQTGYGVLFPEEREITVYCALREAHRISDTLAVGYASAPYQGNNRYLSELASRHRWVHPLAFYDPEHPPSEEGLAQLWQERFVGISIYVTDPAKAEALSSPQWHPELLNALNNRGAIVSINVPCSLIRTVTPFLERLEGCRVLLSHLGLPGKVTEEALQEALRPLTALAALPHVGVKASGFYACGDDHPCEYPHQGSHPVFNALLDAFGFRRIFWGSDFSPALEYISFEQTIRILEQFNLDPQQKEGILGGNLRQLLGCLPGFG